MLENAVVLEIPLDVRGARENGAFRVKDATWEFLEAKPAHSCSTTETASRSCVLFIILILFVSVHLPHQRGGIAAAASATLRRGLFRL